MKVIDYTELNGGKVSVDIELSDEEIAVLLNYAFNKILGDYIEQQDNSTD